jgi:protein-tyrosine-phosphatase
MTTITIDRAVLEQALEALDSCDLQQSFDDCAVDAAIAALRNALNAPSNNAPPSTDDGQGAKVDKPEPVAWMTHHNSVALMPLFHHDKASALSWGGGDPVPLYAAPPRREWVGLTDEEIHDCWQQSGRDKMWTRRMVTRAIEQALKERNHE